MTALECLLAEEWPAGTFGGPPTHNPPPSPDPRAHKETTMTHTEIITVLAPGGAIPHPSRFHHTDIDGDRLLISTALAPDGTPGIYFRTDRNGSALPLDKLPALIAQLQVIAEASRDEAAAAQS